MTVDSDYKPSELEEKMSHGIKEVGFLHDDWVI
jgi:hypothetical protein